MSVDQLNLIQKILSAKVSNIENTLFELAVTDYLVVLDYVQRFYNRMVTEMRIDIPERESFFNQGGAERIIKGLTLIVFLKTQENKFKMKYRVFRGNHKLVA